MEQVADFKRFFTSTSLVILLLLQDKGNCPDRTKMPRGLAACPMDIESLKMPKKQKPGSPSVESEGYVPVSVFFYLQREAQVALTNQDHVVRMFPL